MYMLVMHELMRHAMAMCLSPKARLRSEECVCTVSCPGAVPHVNVESAYILYEQMMY